MHIMVKQFTFNHYSVNCYLVYDQESRKCAIIDPSAETNYEEAQLTQFIEKNNLTPTAILLTHAHVDHIAGLREICNRYHLPVSMHPDGKPLLRQAEVYGDMMGFHVGKMDDLKVCELQDNDILSLDDVNKIECRYVPGHCPGSLCYVLHDEGVVITGDALFQGSIGRTDLPGGDYPTLITKLKSRILTLPDDYLVLPGHGSSSQIGKEKKYNPFLM